MLYREQVDRNMLIQALKKSKFLIISGFVAAYLRNLDNPYRPKCFQLYIKKETQKAKINLIWESIIKNSSNVQLNWEN